MQQGNSFVAENLVRTDPDPALFQAPAGYKVQDMAQMLKGLGKPRQTSSTKKRRSDVLPSQSPGLLLDSPRIIKE